MVEESLESGIGDAVFHALVTDSVVEVWGASRQELNGITMTTEWKVSQLKAIGKATFLVFDLKFSNETLLYLCNLFYSDFLLHNLLFGRLNFVKTTFSFTQCYMFA